MRSTLSARLLAAAAVTAVVACGSGPKAVTSSRAKSAERAWDAEQPVRPEAFPLAPPFVSLGERMTYRLSMHQLEVATFTIVVGQLGELAGRRVVVVQSGVQSSPIVSMVKKVEDNFTSWIDAATARPVLFRASELASADDQITEGSDSEVAEAADGRFPVRVTREDGEELVEHQTIRDVPVFDMNGFLMVLRGWDAEEGTTATADVIRSRFVWRTQVTMQGYESVVTELGELPAVRIDGVSRRVGRDGEIDPKSDTRQYTIWISDDADRVPLLLVARTDYGDIRMEIVDYAAGTGRLQ